MSDLIERDISAEEWREVIMGIEPPYRILSPKTLITRPGGSTHRVVDSNGVVHCYPAPETGKSIVRWKPRDAENPVQF